MLDHSNHSRYISWEYKIRTIPGIYPRNIRLELFPVYNLGEYKIRTIPGIYPRNIRLELFPVYILGK